MDGIRGWADTRYIKYPPTYLFIKEEDGGYYIMGVEYGSACERPHKWPVMGTSLILGENPSIIKDSL